jgi:DNA modification methylase
VWTLDWEGRARPAGSEHPTQKPVECFAIPIRKHTLAGEVCYEPFAGSGTQLIAAESTGRRCYALEISPTFVDVAVRRWEVYTGTSAQLQPGA